MNNSKHFDSSSEHKSEHVKLARWLQHVLITSPQEETSLSSKDDTSPPGLLLNSDYHPNFYKQIPNFIMALLQNDPQATVHYAPLLYHLAACTTCHTAYLELYDAMRYAIKTGDAQPVVNHGTRPLATIPMGTLVNLCQLLINQAEAELRQARHDHTDADALARSLLQLAMKVSTQIMQSSLRGRALKDLVRVATLFDGPHAPGEQVPDAHSYSPLIGAGGTSRQGKVVRRADTATRAGGKITEPPSIYLQSSSLDGRITQHENVLELHLRDLDETLRGHYLIISVPLGSLLEPVRWEGGNPRSIRSVAPVDKDGTLRTPVGQTDLRLSDLDDRNLLEIMFLRLEVRSVE